MAVLGEGERLTAEGSARRPELVHVGQIDASLDAHGTLAVYERSTHGCCTVHPLPTLVLEPQTSSVTHEFGLLAGYNERKESERDCVSLSHSQRA